MTSIADRPHLRRLSRNAHAGVCIDSEAAEQDDGQQPNQQIRAIGNVELLPDRDANWTTRITEKYLRGPAAAAAVADPWAAKTLGLTEPPIYGAINRLEEVGILKEVTGRQRGKLYVYDEYLAILNEGTAEPV